MTMRNAVTSCALEVESGLFNGSSLKFGLSNRSLADILLGVIEEKDGRYALLLYLLELKRP